MKILFYIEPRVDIGMPYLREAWLNLFTFNIMSALGKSKISEECEYCVALNEPIAKKYGELDGVITKVFTYKELFPPYLGDAVDLAIAWYQESYSEEQISYYVSLMKRKFADFSPDIIITFTPVPFLKKTFPDSLILHHEVSFFNEAPYPWIPYLDPSGMYFANSSFLNRFKDDIKKIQLTNNQKCLLNNFKMEVQSLIKEKSPFHSILAPFKERFDYIVLLPFTGVNNYIFGGQRKVNIKNEYQYLIYILDRIPENIGVIITYPPSLSNYYNNSGVISFFNERYPNFIYHDDFEKYNSVSQFLLADVDMLIGLGSGLCYQTLLFDKKFMDIGGDMSFMSDSSDINDIEKILESDNCNKDSLLYWILTRYAIPMQYIYDHDWLSEFLINSIHKFKNKGVDFDFFEHIDTDEKIFSYLTDNLDKNIPQVSPYPSYPRLKRQYDELKSEHEKINLFNLLREKVNDGERLVSEGKLDESYSLFIKFLEDVDNIRAQIITNIAVIHTYEGKLDIAEMFLERLIREGYTSEEIIANLEIIRQLKESSSSEEKLDV